MSKTVKRVRRCVDCGEDISHRFILTKRCIDCAIERGRRLDVRRARARRRAEKEAQA
jgi:hypothetical protein